MQILFILRYHWIKRDWGNLLEIYQIILSGKKAAQGCLEISNTQKEIKEYKVYGCLGNVLSTGVDFPEDLIQQ